MKNHYSKKNKCLDCNKLILNSSIRCFDCSSKLKKGKRSPHFVNCKCIFCCGKTGRNNPFYGKHHTRETKNKIGESRRGEALNHSKKCQCSFCRDKNGKRNPNYGHKHAPELRRKMSLLRGGTGTPYEEAKYPEEFLKIRRKIRKRDNYTCRECNTIFDKHSKELNVHHIDYDKQNNVESNLLCLCHKCNIRANFNREYWTLKYQKLMRVD